MNRRAFLTVLAATAGASTAIRRTPAGERVYRIAMMAVHEPFNQVFIGRMREIGYRLGENFEFELQGSGANMKFELFPAIATAIVSRHPDVIVAAGSEFVVDALRRAAGSTPVVMIFIDFDRLATGQVATLAHPGGTITGLSVQQTDIASKKIELLQKYRLPYLTTTAFADAGSLLCFSVDFPQLYIRAAELVDRILKGQKPADIPVEQPNKLRLIVNVKTAGALGVTIPRSLLLRADEVVQ